MAIEANGIYFRDGTKWDWLFGFDRDPWTNILLTPLGREVEHVPELQNVIKYIYEALLDPYCPPI